MEGVGRGRHSSGWLTEAVLMVDVLRQRDPMMFSAIFTLRYTADPITDSKAAGQNTLDNPSVEYSEDGEGKYSSCLWEYVRDHVYNSIDVDMLQ